jgi:hypothetical protein
MQTLKFTGQWMTDIIWSFHIIHLKRYNKKGLGVQIDARAFQWSNSLAANALFLVFTITNVSDKDLDTVLFGIYGDPDLGGGSPYNTRDNGLFIPPFNIPNYPPVDNIPVYARSMVYFWDQSGFGKNNIPLGYLGCKFLESPVIRMMELTMMVTG